MPNVATLLTDSADAHPERIAVRVGDAAITYAKLDAATEATAGLLRAKGVGPGDRVGVMLPNVAAFPIAYYAILRIGAVVVPMNPLCKDREVGYFLQDAGAKVLFAWHAFSDAAHGGTKQAGAECVLIEPGEFEALLARDEPASDLVDRAPDDTAVILYTSGTTGRPKGAELTHSNLLRNTAVCRGLFGLDERMVTLGALPLFHAFGQTCGLNTTIAAGGSLTLLPRFDPIAALALIERDRVNLFEGVPTMYSAMLHASNAETADTSTLEVCVSGGSALPVELLHAFEARFGCQVLEGYGLSETSPVASFNHRDRPRKPGSIGYPVAGVQLRVIGLDGRPAGPGERGEIEIRGHNVMKGYWQRPDATARSIDGDGWFKTGDIGTVDEHGYYFIVDRRKELVIRGGLNVYPREIEEVLYEHPAVREAAVIGVPHSELGEEVAAAIVLKAGADATAEDIRGFVKSRVAAYKYPRLVWVVDDLPTGSTGKILKREIVVPSTVEA